MGRGADGKVPVFGLLKRGGRVCTLPIPNAKAKTPMPILESRVVPGRIVYSGSFASYDATHVSTFHHRRKDHGKAFVAVKDRRRHTGGVENFWNKAKRRLRRRVGSRANTSTLPRGNASGGNPRGLRRKRPGGAVGLEWVSPMPNPRARLALPAETRGPCWENSRNYDVVELIRRYKRQATGYEPTRPSYKTILFYAQTGRTRRSAPTVEMVAGGGSYPMPNAQPSF